MIYINKKNGPHFLNSDLKNKALSNSQGANIAKIDESTVFVITLRIRKGLIFGT